MIYRYEINKVRYMAGFLKISKTAVQVLFFWKIKGTNTYPAK